MFFIPIPPPYVLGSISFSFHWLLGRKLTFVQLQIFKMDLLWRFFSITRKSLQHYMMSVSEIKSRDSTQHEGYTRGVR